MKYRGEIDGLRAIAVVPVILFHAGFELFSGGFVGVDVFFVISGYLITTIITNEMDEGKFSLLNFYERRARRILPALFFVVLCCIPFAWFLLPPNDMKDFAQSLVAVATFSSNILFWRESGYFDTAAELKPLLHMWSLAVEEQFYILFPLFLMAAWKFGKQAIVWALVISFFVSLVVAHWGAYNKPSATFYLLPTRAWELLAGSLAAFYLKRASESYPHWLNNLLSTFGLAAIVYSVFAFDAATPFPSLYALIPTVGTVLVILFAVRGSLVNSLLSMRAVVGLGLISYSLYLWHQPVFVFWRHYNLFEPAQTQMLLLSLLCVPLALLTYRLVEAPLRGTAALFNRRQVFTASSLVLSSCILFGGLGYSTSGFAARSSFALHADLEYDTSEFELIPCPENESSRLLGYCFSESNEAEFALFGDSHAEDKFYGLLQAENSNWRMVGNPSCPPLLNTTVLAPDRVDCTDILPAMFDVIDDSTQIELVAISYFHGYPLSEWISATHIARGFSADDMVVRSNTDAELNKVDAFYTGLRDTISFLRDRGIVVVLLIDIPELPYEPSDCLRVEHLCIMKRDEIVKRQLNQRRHYQMFTEQFKEVYIFDPLPIFCQQSSECGIRNSGRVLYRDSHHLSNVGSNLYGRFFQQWLYSEVLSE